MTEYWIVAVLGARIAPETFLPFFEMRYYAVSFLKNKFNIITGFSIVIQQNFVAFIVLIK